jgi:predicted XRE-type DNA-binding protein
MTSQSDRGKTANFRRRGQQIDDTPPRSLHTLWHVRQRPGPDPIPKLKEAVAAAIVARLDGWTQPMAAELLRCTQARVSNLRTGRLERFSLQKLIRMAARLHATIRVDMQWPRRLP